jgi:hypothetical protein
MKAEGSVLLLGEQDSGESSPNRFLVRDEDETERTESAELRPEFDSSAMLLKTLNGMERDKALEGIRKFQGFVDHLKNGLARMKSQESKHVVTKDDIYAILDSRDTPSILGKRPR